MTGEDKAAPIKDMLPVSQTPSPINEPLMMAVVCEEPDPAMDGVRLRAIERPLPAAGQVRIRMEAASLNPVDWKLASGIVPWWDGNGAHVVGLDGAGTIDMLGEGVVGWSAGDRVVWHGDLNRHGVLSEFAIAESHVLTRLPGNIEATSAAALPCAGLTAYQALTRKARLEAGQTVLVQGASGAVGGFAVQIARAKGATVIALARPDQQARVKALGADHVLDRRAEDLKEQVRALTGGHGADIMVEVANPGDARRSLDLIRYNGHLLCIDPMPDLSQVPAYTYAASIHEVALGGAYAAGHVPTLKDFAVMGDELLSLLGQGLLDPMIDRIIPLEGAVMALKEMRDKGTTGKIVVSIGGRT
jgi:NADPH:quinone reductase-like Zn-dependent oxidoreductase